MRFELAGLGVCIVALLACAGSSHTKVAKGTYAIECKRNKGNCYEEAQTVCPGGFDIVDSDSKEGAIVTHYEATDQYVATPTYNGEMLIKCTQ